MRFSRHSLDELALGFSRHSLDELTSPSAAIGVVIVSPTADELALRLSRHSLDKLASPSSRHSLDKFLGEALAFPAMEKN